MSGSNVGESRLYEAGDQRNYSSNDPAVNRERFEEGKANSHKQLDSKDERSLPNKLAHEEKIESREDPATTFENMQSKKDPTLPVNTSPFLLNLDHSLAQAKYNEHTTLTLAELSWLHRQPLLTSDDPQAKFHGNEPSKGAKIDQEIADEEAEILKKKGAFGSKQ